MHEYLTKRGGKAPSSEIKKDGEERDYADSTLKRAKNKLGLLVDSKGYPRRECLTELIEPTTAKNGHFQSGQLAQSGQSGHPPRGVVRLEGTQGMNDKEGRPSGYGSPIRFHTLGTTALTSYASDRQEDLSCECATSSRSLW